MLLNKGRFKDHQLLGRKTIELMTTDHLPLGHGPIERFGFGYGFGVSVLRSLAEKQGIGSIGEYGWGGAACTEEWIDPVEDMVTMVMMQLRPAGPWLKMKDIKQAVYQSLV